MSDGLAKQSSNFIDLVVCKHSANDNAYVFQAPAFSLLRKGDKVIVETKQGEQMAEVERVYTARNSGEELDFILIASGATLPLKRVLKKVTYKEFEYEKGSQNEESRLDSKA